MADLGMIGAVEDDTGDRDAHRGFDVSRYLFHHVDPRPPRLRSAEQLPYVSLDVLRSIGPKDAIPRPAIG